jgi:hypothetical protein
MGYLEVSMGRGSLRKKTVFSKSKLLGRNREEKIKIILLKCNLFMAPVS